MATPSTKLQLFEIANPDKQGVIIITTQVINKQIMAANRRQTIASL